MIDGSLFEVILVRTYETSVEKPVSTHRLTCVGGKQVVVEESPPLKENSLEE